MGEGDVVSIVDDDESLRVALAGLLRSAGRQVATFPSADAFLRSPRARATGCLILDLRMPGMGGLDLQRELAGAGYRIPIVVLTAHGDEAARRRALGGGALAFLSKPFDVEALLRAVDAALRNR